MRLRSLASGHFVSLLSLQIFSAVLADSCAAEAGYRQPDTGSRMGQQAEIQDIDITIVMRAFSEQKQWNSQGLLINGHTKETIGVGLQRFCSEWMYSSNAGYKDLASEESWNQERST